MLWYCSNTTAQPIRSEDDILNYIISILKMLNLHYSAYCTLYKNKPTDLICESASNLFKINSMITTLSIKPSQLFYDIKYHTPQGYTKEHISLNRMLQSLDSSDIIFIDTVYSLGDTYQDRIVRLEHFLQSGALIIFMDELIWKRYNTSFAKSLYKDSDDNLNNTKELLQVIRKKSQSNIKRIIKREVINMGKNKDTDNQTTVSLSTTVKKQKQPTKSQKQPTKNKKQPTKKLSSNKTRRADTNVMKELNSMILDDGCDISFEHEQLPQNKPEQQHTCHQPEQQDTSHQPEQIVLPEVKAITNTDNQGQSIDADVSSKVVQRYNEETDISQTKKPVIQYTILKTRKSKELNDRSHRAKIRFQQLQSKYPIENQLYTIDDTDSLAGISLATYRTNKEQSPDVNKIQYPDKNSLKEFVEFFDNMVQNPKGTGKQIIPLEDIRNKYKFDTVVEVLNYYNYCCSNV